MSHSDYLRARVRLEEKAFMHSDWQFLIKEHSNFFPAWLVCRLCFSPCRAMIWMADSLQSDICPGQAPRWLEVFADNAQQDY
mmetsp:Transcript_111724/g.176009  ORF Transcript_111724/g.176009 Transcript_111724/m.176009 type:complete len:82 (+) Transcript_111724:684-929(+)